MATVWALMMPNFFYNTVAWRFRFIRAEPPCGKGEIQIGPFVWWWERK